MADDTAQSIIDRYKKQGLSYISVLAGTSKTTTTTNTTNTTNNNNTNNTNNNNQNNGGGSSLLSSVGGLGSLAVGVAGLTKGNGAPLQPPQLPANLQGALNSTRTAYQNADLDYLHAQGAQLANPTADTKQEADLAKLRYDQAKSEYQTAQNDAADWRNNNPAVQKQGFMQKNASTLEFAGGAIGGAVAGNYLYNSIQDLIDKGTTFTGVLKAAGSLLGLAGAMTVMHHALMAGGVFIWGVYPNSITTPIAGAPATVVLFAPNVRWMFGAGLMLENLAGPWLPKFLYWLTSMEGILAVGGLIVAAAILTDLLNGTPSDDQTALEDLPVWDTGKVLAIASTAAFLSAGYNIDASPMSLTSAGIPISVSDLTTKIFAGQDYSTPIMNTDGSAFYDGKTKQGVFDDGSPIVVQGPNGKNSEILEITKGGIVNGVAMDNVKVINLADGLSFQAPTDPSGLYIPWDVNGKLNADAVNNTTNMNDLMAACQQGLLDPVSCQNAMTLAASKSKSVTSGSK